MTALLIVVGAVLVVVGMSLDGVSEVAWLPPLMVAGGAVLFAVGVFWAVVGVGVSW